MVGCSRSTQYKISKLNYPDTSVTGFCPINFFIFFKFIIFFFRKFKYYAKTIFMCGTLYAAIDYSDSFVDKL